MHSFLQTLLLWYIQLRTWKLDCLDAFYTATGKYLPMRILQVLVDIWSWDADFYHVIIDSQVVRITRVSDTYASNDIYARWQWSCKYNFRWDKLQDLYDMYGADKNTMKLICVFEDKPVKKIKIRFPARTPLSYEYQKDKALDKITGIVMFNDIDVSEVDASE